MCNIYETVFGRIISPDTILQYARQLSLSYKKDCRKNNIKGIFTNLKVNPNYFFEIDANEHIAKPRSNARVRGPYQIMSTI